MSFSPQFRSYTEESDLVEGALAEHEVCKAWEIVRTEKVKEKLAAARSREDAQHGQGNTQARHASGEARGGDRQVRREYQGMLFKLQASSCRRSIDREH